jgi:myosin V
VRCIKPNSKFSPDAFDSKDVCMQLKCAGMLEAIRIRKAGFAIRIDNQEFCRRYKPCLKGTAVQFKDKLANEVCKGILTLVFDKGSKMDGKWQLGFTKVFLKEEARAFLEMRLGESLKD